MPNSFTRFRFVNVPPSLQPARKATYTGYSGLNRVGAPLIAAKRLVDEAMPGYPPPLTLPIRILLPGGAAAEDYNAIQIADQVMSVALEHTADAYDGPVHTLVVQKGDETYLMEVIVQFQGIDTISGKFVAQVQVKWTDGRTERWDEPYMTSY